MEKLLELENVSYSYQDGKEKNQILDHASYLFEKGKIYAGCWCEVEAGKQQLFLLPLVR